MRITLYGAAGMVTGSAYHVQTRHASVLVDFGMFQGSRADEKQNKVPRDLRPERLSTVVLTHGHLDHTGRLPLLAQRGFSGRIFATAATIEMTGLILKDAAKVQAQDADRENRKRQRAGLPPIKPMYELEDVEAILKQLVQAPYHEPTEVAPGVVIRLVDSGHMLGSASIEMTLEEDGRKKVVVFSGDVGPHGLPILRDSATLNKADLVFLESTYGDRDHKSPDETKRESLDAIKWALQHKGKILVPAFAIGRTQQIMYELAKDFLSGQLPRFPVYIDSPMAQEANHIYGRHTELYDDEAERLSNDPAFMEEMKRLVPCESSDDSKELNSRPGPFMVIAGSGMCNAGRILHHLKQNLWRPETLVMIVGYQGVGTLGRRLVDAARDVRIFGEKIQVNARVVTLGGYSAHAGQTDLMNWLGAMIPSRPRVILTHGESRGRKPLARLIQERHGIEAEMPELGHTIDV